MEVAGILRDLGAEEVAVSANRPLDARTLEDLGIAVVEPEVAASPHAIVS
jgi:hypothetical protein